MISVVYTSKEDAVSALEALGLTAKTTEDYSSSVEKGCVISQSIEAGTQVEKGSMVMLSISILTSFLYESIQLFVYIVLESKLAHHQHLALLQGKQFLYQLEVLGICA